MLPITKKDSGCWIDGANGIHIPDRIILIAKEYGFVQTPDSTDLSEEENTLESAEEAVRFLNTLAPEGFEFGYNENWGDFGLYPIEEN